MNNHEPTKKQALILEFIENYILENEKAPSYREIASGVGLSSIASVSEHIDNLIIKGCLIKNPGSARSLEVVKHPSYQETKNLFKARIKTATEEEKEVLEKAKKILGI